MNKLFSVIDSLNEKYQKIWEDVANIESPTWHKEGVDAVGKYFADIARGQGWEVEILRLPEAGNVVGIVMNATAKESAVTLCGHIDTVHPVGSFGTPAVKTDDANIYGPGVMDCKGGVVAAAMAMEALEKCGFRDRPVRLLLQTDEECNSSLSNKKTINYILDKAKDSVAFLNCESSRKGTLVLERKGIIRYRFEISGKEIHSSRCSEGASAILEAAHKIAELEKFKDSDGLTCNCGTISGGDAENTVPKYCTFSVDIRFSTGDELTFIKEKIEELAKVNTVPGCTTKVTQTGFRPAMELTKRNLELLEKMNKIYEECGLPMLTKRKSLGGSDAADATYAGIPCIDSIGVEGDFIHTVSEYAVKKSLGEAAKRIAAVICRI